MNTAGTTNIRVGTKVKLINLKHEDKELNGMTGTVTHPFAIGKTAKGWVGIYVDSNCITPYGAKLNVHESEIEVLN